MILHIEQPNAPRVQIGPCGPVSSRIYLLGYLDDHPGPKDTIITVRVRGGVGLIAGTAEHLRTTLRLRSSRDLLDDLSC